MSILLGTMGLPRSGKSTWARAFSKKHGLPIVEPDAIRLALHGHKFIASAEPLVWATAQLMVASLFGAGHDVVLLDSTNVTRKRRDEWQKRFKTYWVPFLTDIATCEQRAAQIGDRDLLVVIRVMASTQEGLLEDELMAVPAPDLRLQVTERLAVRSDRPSDVPPELHPYCCDV